MFERCSLYSLLGLEYENVLLAVTDAAPAMIAALKSLRVLFPKIIHITCLAHGLHRLAEHIRSKFDNVNALISNMKSVFLKSPKRIRYFRDNAMDAPLPPSPVVTRWGTWLNAAIYYADHFELIEFIVQGLVETESEAIVKVKEVIKKEKLFAELTFIKANFAFLPIAITELETRGSPINAGIEKVLNVRRKLRALKDNTYATKWEKVIGKNPGFSLIEKLNKMIQGDEIDDSDLRELKKTYTSADIAAYKFAPLCSADVERIFSQYKSILRDNRQSFKFENLQKHVVLKCNSHVEEEVIDVDD